MRYFIQKVKNKATGDIVESVLLYDGSSNHPVELMAREELIDSREISKEEAIQLCGREAIIGEKE